MSTDHKCVSFVDGDGKWPAEEMRTYFEAAIKQTPRFQRTTPLGAMMLNGAFHHYIDADTDTMWIGFALGMRAAQRIYRSGPLSFFSEGSK